MVVVLLWAGLSLAMVVAGIAITAAGSKEIGGINSTSLDTSTSRVGLTLATVGVLLLVGSILGLPRLLRPIGMFGTLIVLLAGVGLLVRAPQVEVTSPAHPSGAVSHSCGGTALHQVLGADAGERQPQALLDCEDAGRKAVLTSLVGTAAAGGLIIGFLRPREEHLHDEAVDSGY